MPLVAATVIAYAAGLLAAFGGALAWAIGAGVAASVALQCGRNSRDRVLIAAIGVGAFGAATVARVESNRCTAQLLASSEWRVTLAADAAPGAFVSGRAECGSTARLSVVDGVAPSGSEVAARGTAMQGRGGPMLPDARLRVTRAPSVLARWRAAVGAGIDAHFGADAPLVRALLIADMNDLSPTLRDRFSAAGISHMLSVSGLHVGLIAVAVLLIAQVARLRPRSAELAVVSICAAYVIVIGAPLPAVRSAAMLAVVSLSKSVQRPTSGWAVLAVGAGLPLVDPTAILDIGYQLSVVGMVALIASGALTKRWHALSVGGWRGTLYRSVAASTVATLMTAPLVAATFGRISFVAPVSNLAAGPVMAVLQPMLFLAAILLPMAGAAQFVADACHPLLVLLDRIASFAATLPGSSVSVVSDPTSFLMASLGGGAFVVAAVSRFPGRALVTGAACVAALVCRPLLPGRSEQTEVHMIDVGQGDAIALRTRAGHWVLFDAGREWQGGDEGARDVVPYIASRGGSLTAFVLSHPHADHVGGAVSTFRALRPTFYYDPGYAGSSGPYRASLIEAQRMRATWRRVHPADTIVIDEATITFLAPDSAWAEAQADPNLASAIARVQVGDVSFLMTGDAEAPEEEWLLAHEPLQLGADVLKVGHHGSRTSSTPAFLDAVRPRLALVSVGTGNMYGHPSASVMQSLAARGALVLRTDRVGTIVVRTDGRHIEVETAGERWQLRR